jgi:RHS repeat-associated protein
MPNFAFNAKELDEENNMYYYSARYYAPPTFISRDPMFEKYPSISPYTYCANNPMKFVDPTGRDIYQVDENGNAVGKPIKNSKFDQFQVVSVDKDGNKTVISSSEKYKSGTVVNRATNISTGKKDENGKPINIDAYAIKGSKEGESIHQFLSKNTNVEYGRWDFKSSLGEINVIGTSHQKTEEGSGPYIKSFLSKNNWFGYLQTQDHNHPSGDPSPSGFGKSDVNGDKFFIQSIEQANPEVNFRIYTKKGYNYYNSLGPTLKPVTVR